MAKKEKSNNKQHVPFKDLAPKDKVKRILGVIGSVGQIILVVFALILSVVVIVYSYDREQKELPSAFGISFLTVESVSMDYDTEQAALTYAELDSRNIAHDNKFKKEDLIIVREYDGKSELKVGDVVTFWDSSIPYEDASGNRGWFNTHRIVEVREDGYVTRGDNNAADDTTVRSRADIKAVWNGSKISGWGSVIDWIKDSTHFLLVIVLPLAVLFFINVFMFIREIVRHKVDKTSKKLAEDKEALVEAAKQAAIAEYLAKQAELEKVNAEINENKENPSSESIVSDDDNNN